MSYEIQMRRDTSSNWTSVNPILGQGEFGYETNTGKLKIGDGTTAWNSLGYYSAGSILSVTATAPITSSGGANPNIALTAPLPIVDGGTNAITAAAAYNNLSPMTTTGDLEYEVSTGVAGRLGIGTTGQVLTVAGGLPTWSSAGGGGINQLTGDVTAGPGSGSQAATVAKIQGTTVSGTTGTTNVVFSASPTLTGTALFTNMTGSGTLIVPTVEGAASGGTILVQGGTAASGGAGGVVTIDGAAGSNVTTGGAGGNVNINAGAAQGNNTQNNAGGAVSISAGASVGSSTGGTITLTCGTGGIGTSTAGATGGTINLNGGTGGAGSATSGNGGGATLKAGSGGNGVAGGTGGQASLTGGTGGTGSGSGGNGGSAQVQGGSPASFAGAAGGAVTIASGNGTGTGAGGAGGSITISTGTAGGDNTQNNSGGSLTLSVGHSIGSASGNQVSITAGTGGIGTSTTGATGGNTTIAAGTGGAGSATGGAGGNTIITAGAGGSAGSPGAGGFIQFQVAATTSLSERFRITSTEAFVSNAQLEVKTAGFGLGITHGSNCKLGTSTLSAGTVTVSNTAVTANSLILLTAQSLGTVAVPQALAITAKTAGTSFVITSASATDTSVVLWMIIEGL